MMSEERFCDICGRFEHELPEPVDSKEPKLTIDEDGLWLCNECGGKVTTEPVGDGWNVALDEEVAALIGESAGTILRDLGLPNEAPYLFLLAAASKLSLGENQVMSSWRFINQWLDGSTVWRAEDGRGMAIVTSDGRIQLNPDWFAD